MNVALNCDKGINAIPVGNCADCEVEVYIDRGTNKGDTVICEECGVKLEVVGLDPVKLDLPEEELDETEEEDEEDKAEGLLIKAKQEYIALAQIRNKVRLVSLRADGSYSFLDDAQNLHNKPVA